MEDVVGILIGVIILNVVSIVLNASSYFKRRYNEDAIDTF